MNEKIAVNNLNLYYGNMKVLNNIDVSFEENSITALIGPSGCGKTSFLRTLNRFFLMKPKEVIILQSIWLKDIHNLKRLHTH